MESPFLTPERTSESVKAAVFDVVLTTVPFLVQTYVSVTGLPLGSLAVAVAVSTALVVVLPDGPFDERATVADGAMLPTTTSNVAIAPLVVPSLGMTWTSI